MYSCITLNIYQFVKEITILWFIKIYTVHFIITVIIEDGSKLHLTLYILIR